MECAGVPGQESAVAGAFLSLGALVVLAILTLGCNAVLGIDKASLEPSLNGDAGGACSAFATTSCGVCVAENCCAEFQACRANEDCGRALEKYNGCVQ
jgi:hypothetical protein